MNYSAKKRVRQNAKRRLHNRIEKSINRTLIKSYESALNKGDKESAAVELKKVQKALSSSVNKNVLHKKTASRKLSRLTKRYNKTFANA